MRRVLVSAVAAAAAAACGSGVDLSQNCSMNVSVNGGAQQTVSCFAAGAFAPSTGNAVSIAMTGALASVQAAQFAMTLPSAPSVRTYTATGAEVTASAGQVQTTGALYTQSKAGAVGTFSVVLTSVNGVSANGQTAYFLHGTATVTLAGQGTAAPSTATITATF